MPGIKWFCINAATCVFIVVKQIMFLWLSWCLTFVGVRRDDGIDCCQAWKGVVDGNHDNESRSSWDNGSSFFTSDAFAGSV